MDKFRSIMKFWFRVLITPSCWSRNYTTNKYLSAYINLELDQLTEIKIINEYRIKLGTKALWSRNYPYAFGYEVSGVFVGMPDRKTVFRLYDALVEKLYHDI